METKIIMKCRAAGTHRLNQYGVCLGCNRLYAERAARRIAAQVRAIDAANPDGVRLVIEASTDMGSVHGLDRHFPSAKAAIRAENEWSERYGDGTDYTASLFAASGAEITYPE